MNYALNFSLYCYDHRTSCWTNCPPLP
ncbi:MAG: hypothetical protein JW783_00065 [Bacteroidales bacterium]|nr:hypothetical protein [Bacteroidales bacterium]MBN2748724.1 hypothetical protein [Bacteroidales bacterium]